MFVKDFGYATRLSVVSKVMMAVLLFHGLLIMCEGVMFGAIPCHNEGRVRSFTFWRIYTQPVSLFGVLATLWLMRNNWSGWRYWVHLIASGVFAAWNGVAFGWGMLIYTKPLGATREGAGEDPLGTPLPHRTHPDWAWTTLMTAVGASAILHCAYIAFNLWLRRSVELRLALSAAASRVAQNPNAQLMSPGIWGQAGPVNMMQSFGGVVPMMAQIGAEQQQSGVDATLEQNNWHTATDSQLYCHDCYVFSELDNDLTPLTAKEAHKVASFIRDRRVPYLRVVRGPMNQRRTSDYANLVESHVAEQYRPHFRQTLGLAQRHSATAAAASVTAGSAEHAPL